MKSRSRLFGDLWPSRADTGAKAEAEAVLCLAFAGRREVGVGGAV